MPAIPVARWAVCLIVVWLLRRNRRVVARLPIVGLSVLCAAAIGYGLARVTGLVRVSADVDAALRAELLAWGSTLTVPLVAGWLWAAITQDIPRISRVVRQRAGWTLVCIGLGAAACVPYAALGRQFQARGLFQHYDVLFEADPPRFCDVTELETRNTTHKHPLLPLFWYAGLRAAAGVTGWPAAPLATNVALGGACVALAAAYFRAVTGSRLLAVLSAALLGSTTAHVVFASIPESFMASAATLILLNLLVSWRNCPALRLRHFVAAGMLATGVTLTNFAVAAASFLFVRRARRGRYVRRWTVRVLALSVFALAIEYPLFPKVGLNAAESELDVRYVTRAVPPAERIANVTRGLFVENVVAAGPHRDESTGNIMAGGERNALGWIAAGVWALAGGAALVGLRRTIQTPAFYVALIGLAVPAAIHSVYGNTNLFLYSGTFTFFTVAVLVHGLTGLPRCWAAAVLLVLLSAVALNSTAFCTRVLTILDGCAPAGVR